MTCSIPPSSSSSFSSDGEGGEGGEGKNSPSLPLSQLLPEPSREAFRRLQPITEALIAQNKAARLFLRLIAVNIEEEILDTPQAHEYLPLLAQYRALLDHLEAVRWQLLSYHELGKRVEMIAREHEV